MNRKNRQLRADLLELFIVLSFVFMIITIYVPKAIWEDELAAEQMSRFYMQNVYDVESFYNILTGAYTTDGLMAMNIVNAARDSLMADSTFMGENWVRVNTNKYKVNIPKGFDVEFDTTFGFPKVRRDTLSDTTHTIAIFSEDLGRNDTIFIQHKTLAEYQNNENFVSLISTETKLRSELINYYDSYYPDSSMFNCPLTKDPYIISLTENNNGVRVASPITDFYKERRYMIFSFRTGSHGYINDGVRSWE